MGNYPIGEIVIVNIIVLSAAAFVVSVAAVQACRFYIGHNKYVTHPGEDSAKARYEQTAQLMDDIKNRGKK